MVWKGVWRLSAHTDAPPSGVAPAMFKRLLVRVCNRSLAGSIRLSQGVSVVLDSAGHSSAEAPETARSTRLRKPLRHGLCPTFPASRSAAKAVDSRLFDQLCHQDVEILRRGKTGYLPTAWVGSGEG